MSFSAKEMIKQRRSIRTFDGRPLSEEDRKYLADYVHEPLANPFHVPVEFRLLDAKEHQLSSPVIVEGNTYIAAKVKRAANCEIAYGCSFEKFCLYALSRGIGTVMLAASLSRAAFEKAMEVMPDEVMPTATPVGYPASKKSIREGLMRKGLKADDRKPFDSIFFDKTFDRGLKKEDAGIFADALEAARWAPSAGNQQPWRAVADGKKVHFYEAKTMKENSLGDVQKVDVGIALAHFDMVLEEEGITGSFVFADPKIPAPENTQYIVTFVRS